MYDVTKRNAGLNPREFRRFLNGQYEIELDGQLYAKGYTKEEGWQAFNKYQKDNAKQIERRKQRSENLRLNNEKQKEKRKKQ